MTSKNEIAFSSPKNQSHQFDIDETNEITTVTHTKENKNTFSKQTSFTYNITNGNNQQPKVSVSFDGMEKHTKIGGTNDDQNVPSAYDRSLKALEGATMNVNLNSSGEVSDVLGYDDLEKKAVNIYNSIDDVDGHPKSGTTRIFNKNFFIDIFDQISNVLSSHSINVGSTWERMEAEELGTEKDIKTFYTCNKIENGIAYISSSGELKKTIAYNNASMLLKGQIMGSYELDANTGILIKGKRCITVNGSTQINTVHFGMTVNKTLTINGKQIGDVTAR